MTAKTQRGYVRSGRKRQTRDVARDILVYLIILAFFLPALWIILTSIRPNVEINTRPPIWIPRQIDFTSYLILLGQPTPEGAFAMGGKIPISAYARNSTVIALTSTLIALVFGTLAGFTFARFSFKGKNTIFLSMMLARAVPGVALSLPLFILFARMGLSDKVLGMIIAYAALNIPFTAWLMDGFFRALPQELDDAALIDGCSRWTALLRVDLPWLAASPTAFCFPHLLERVCAGDRHHTHAGFTHVSARPVRVYRLVRHRLAWDVRHVGDDAHPVRHLCCTRPAPVG
jgi:multiple sugar transport system permease protein